MTAFTHCVLCKKFRGGQATKVPVRPIRFKFLKYVICRNCFRDLFRPREARTCA